MAETTITLVRASDGVLASLPAEGNNFVIKYDGVENEAYYTYRENGVKSYRMRDTVAPSKATLSVTPAAQSTLYAGVVASITDTFYGFDLNLSGIDGDTVTVTALAGTVANVSVDSENTVTFDYTSPAQALDTITVAGSDLAGNAFSIETTLELDA